MPLLRIVVLKQNIQSFDSNSCKFRNFVTNGENDGNFLDMLPK
jgi:hypothetical protein